MHDSKNINNKNGKTVASKRKSEEEMKSVVDSILDEVIMISDDEDSMDETISPSLDEVINVVEEKKYCNECGDCGLKLEAKRRYLVVQLLKKHKESCHGKNNNAVFKTSCNLCDFKAKESYLLRRHMRDEHNINSGSTSPPQKKKKILSKDNFQESQEVIEDDDEVLNLSSKLEDMEIDEVVCEETKEMKERSDKIEKKVLEKESLRN